MTQNDSEEIPEYAQGGYKHTEADLESGFIFDHIQGVDSFKDYSNLKFPVHLELKKDTIWYRIEETGKFYRITKELYYLFGNTEVRQDRYDGDDIAELEVREMYALIFGNISRKDTIGGLHFYTRQMAKSSYQVLSESQFQEKLAMISQDFDRFIEQSYPNLKENGNNWKEREEQGSDGTPF